MNKFKAYSLSAWGFVSWFFRQMFSSKPDDSKTSAIKLLSLLSRGLLIAAALTSMTYTVPSSYSIYGGIGLSGWSLFVAVWFTAVLLLFCIELSLGGITPFGLKNTFNGKFFGEDAPNQMKFAGVMVWSLMVLLMGMSMFFTYNGSHVAIHTAIGDFSSENIHNLQLKKDSAVVAITNRWDATIAKTEASDSVTLSEKQKAGADLIAGRAAYIKKKYGRRMTELEVARAKRDSAEAVDQYQSTLSIVMRDKMIAIDDAKDDWDKLIAEARSRNQEGKQKHETKITTATMLVTGFGTLSAVGFLILQVLIALLETGATLPSTGGKSSKKEPLPKKIKPGGGLPPNQNPSRLQRKTKTETKVSGNQGRNYPDGVRKKLFQYAWKFQNNDGTPENALLKGKEYLSELERVHQDMAKSSKMKLVTDYPDFYEKLMKK